MYDYYLHIINVILRIWIIIIYILQEYFNMRVSAIEERRSAGENPFPHKFQVSFSLSEYIAKYEHLKADDVLSDVTVNLAGMSTFDPSDSFQAAYSLNGSMVIS